MASSIPAQLRAVDPYASYNSNIVNQLTGMVTRGSDGLDFYNSLQVISDSTSASDHVVVLPGFIYKDDMLIEITSEHRVDFTNPAHYVSPPINPFVGPDVGSYYIVLEYTYIKSRPAPKAYIKILLPSQTASFRLGSFPSLFFLKAVTVIDNGGIGEITGLYDFDPDHPNTKRIYLHNYTSSEVGLPIHNQQRDQSRVVYDSKTDQFYLGFSDRWGLAGGADFIVNEDGWDLGELVYVTNAGNLQAALGNFAVNTADGGVISSSNGKTIVRVTGPLNGVKAESGVNLSVGDLVYVSSIEAGTVTNNRTSPFWQFAGRVTEVVDSTSVNIIFHRGEPNGVEGIDIGISSSGTLSGGGWTPDGGFVSQSIDISSFDKDNIAITIWDSTTEMKIQPENLEYISDSILKIFMPSGFSGNLEYLAIGPPASTSTGELEKVVDTLSGVDWISSGGQYYGDINVSAIDLSQGAIVLVLDSTSGEQVYPVDIQYDSTNNLRIWMDVNTESLKIIAIGPANTPSGQIATFTTNLASGGSWTIDGSLYYQDINISSLGNDDIVFDIKDSLSLERIEHSKAKITSGNLRIWMSNNTADLEVTIFG